jgi:hypothetical protein
MQSLKAVARQAQKKRTEVRFLHIAMPVLGWLMGLEPTTTRITIWDSTN